MFMCDFTCLDLQQGASRFCCHGPFVDAESCGFFLKAKLLLRKRASPSTRRGAEMLKTIRVSLLHRDLAGELKSQTLWKVK